MREPEVTGDRDAARVEHRQHAAEAAALLCAIRSSTTATTHGSPNRSGLPVRRYCSDFQRISSRRSPASAESTDSFSGPTSRSSLRTLRPRSFQNRGNLSRAAFA